MAYKPGDKALSIGEFIRAMCEKTAGHGLEILIEPGRSIVAEAGVLLTRVLYRKTNGEREFVIVDAAMNDLIRPALYHSHHEIIPLRENQSGDYHGRRGGAGLRIGRFSGARPRDGQRDAGRSARGLHRRRLRIRRSVELQCSPAPAGDSDRRRPAIA